MGHTSAKCPKNEKGIYKNGGECHRCGSKTHLAKDCPVLPNKSKCSICGDPTHYAKNCPSAQSKEKTFKIRIDPNKALNKIVTF